MLAYRCLQMKWWAALTVVAIPSQKALLMCPYVSSGKFAVLALRWVSASGSLHNVQPTSDRHLILASQLATGMFPANAIISHLFCLQGTRGSSMMIIDFITVKSGLVTLTESLCAQICYFRFEIICILRSHHIFCFFSLKEKMCSRKEHRVQDPIPPPSVSRRKAA